MAAHKTDRTLPDQARRMKASGVKRAHIARALGVCLTTVDWYLRTTIVYLRCEHCGGRMDPLDPHQHETRRSA